MSQKGLLSTLRRGTSRMLRVLGRPARHAQGERGVVLEPYRGYGSCKEIFLIGRAFWQSPPERAARRSELGGDLHDILRRIVRRAVPDATVTASFAGTQLQTQTDRDGYFRIHLRPERPPPRRDEWHEVELRMDEPRPVRATGQVFIPPEQCRYVVISDIDDTVMHTGVANKLKMLWRLFVEDAGHRVAFPGVAALYRAFHRGRAGNEGNPMLYVSRAPWGIYDVLEEFFDRNRIPIGPILFLREWGVSWKSPLPRKAEHHKHELISNMLALYDELPFILIGDSGQHDPEVYRQIVAEHPGRVLAVYIRNVSCDERRIAEINGLAAAMAEAGSTLLLASDSMAFARHAVEHGLLHADALAEVAAESEAVQAPAPSGSPRRVQHRSPQATARAVEEGELERILEETDDRGAPPDVVVEPDRQQEAHRG
ncbi:App1 family protein [Geminicoccus harenae]|uniref:App1 family protein n=1 Tax=Geminicoccus harenae TaxID=2498453 RepID=UPI00168B40D9|nr:phosphatase domain-containing protein [Geminicoccus harenae]